MPDRPPAGRSSVSHPLEVWKGEFGQAYTDRNVIDWRSRLSAFRRMLDGLSLTRVCEVGCNRGHNLLALTELLGGGSEIVGVEPNRYALQAARSASPQLGVVYGDAFDLPFKDGSFDLVFTSGVLIHVPPSGLSLALAEIHRTSRRYILAIEYFADEDRAIPYRGHDDLLWKRNFLAHYQRQFPELHLLQRGIWGREDGFDDTDWWLLEKPAGHIRA